MILTYGVLYIRGKQVEKEQERLAEKVAQYNVVYESNKQLRIEKRNLESELKGLRERVKYVRRAMYACSSGGSCSDVALAPVSDGLRYCIDIIGSRD